MKSRGMKDTDKQIGKLIDKAALASRSYLLEAWEMAKDEGCMLSFDSWAAQVLATRLQSYVD